jgi:hypothetical protein
MEWVKTPSMLAIWQRIGLSPIAYAICENCAAPLPKLPPILRQKFAEKCERNISNEMGVFNG